LVEETGENHRPVAKQWQTISHNVVSSTPCHERGSNSQFPLIKLFFYTIYIFFRWQLTSFKTWVVPIRHFASQFCNNTWISVLKCV
jgi:hypothetical protein